MFSADWWGCGIFFREILLKSVATLAHRSFLVLLLGVIIDDALESAVDHDKDDVIDLGEAGESKGFLRLRLALELWLSFDPLSLLFALEDIDEDASQMMALSASCKYFQCSSP